MTHDRERSAAQLMRDFGTTSPAPRTRQAGRQRQTRQRINRPIAPRRGRLRAGAGWAPVEPPLTVYQAATSEIGGLWPLLASNGIPAMGARIGYDVMSGGAFYCSPIDWVTRFSIAANPNIVCFGEPGRGKSSTVVAFALRMMLFDTKTLISGDVKGEYSPLLRALGITPISLGGGSAARLNALDLGPMRRRWSGWSVERQREEINGVLSRWVTLLSALAQAQGYQPSVTDEAVLAAVLNELVGVGRGYTDLSPVTIPDVQRALADPAPELWSGMRFADRRQFLDHTRLITDVLSNLISGPLSGLFDAETNFELDWDAPAQSMDLSLLRSRGDQAIAVALTCLGTWASMVTDLQDDGDIRIVVRDEVWRQLRLGTKAVQAVDSDLRLSRAEKKIQILVGHKPSDFLSVGDAGSQEVSIARDLLALCSTRILCGQSTRVADELANDLSLSSREQAVAAGWAMERRGRALWKIENQPGYKVQTVLSQAEKAVFDTNAPLRKNSGGGADAAKMPHFGPGIGGRK